MNWDERIEEVRKFNRRYDRLFKVLGALLWIGSPILVIALAWMLVRWLL